MILIDGKKTAADIRAELGAEVAAACAEGHRAPGLAVILVGEDPASQVYVRNKERACAEAGIVSFPHHLPATTSQQDLLRLIAECNANPAVDGILLQLPLPKGLDAQECLLAIDPEKARRYREESTPEHSDTCTMCGKMCAVRNMNKILGGKNVDVI